MTHGSFNLITSKRESDVFDVKKMHSAIAKRGYKKRQKAVKITSGAHEFANVA